MPIHYDIEADYLYKKGYKKGFEIGYKIGLEIGRRQAAEIVITSLIQSISMTDEEIAKALNMPVTQIIHMRNSIQS